MEDVVAILIRLQGVDTTIKNTIGKKNEIPKMLSELDEGKRHAEALLEEAKSTVGEIEKKRKEKEGMLVRLSDDLRKTKSKQFDVKTNKEFEAMLKEMENIEFKIGHTEEEIIILLDEIKQAKTDLADGEKKHKEFLRDYENQKNGLGELGKIYDDELANCSTAKQSLRESLPADVIKKYEAIRNLHSGSAVVHVLKEICQGCFVNIPPQMNNELITSKELTLCPRCNRIIFYQASEVQ